MDEPAPRPTRPILLVGMPGTGKSTIGSLLAAHLGLPFHDSDAMIEAGLGQSVAEIFTRHGEACFRHEEKALLADLMAGPPAVIAAGGGAFLDPETRALAAGRVVAVWLDADLNIIEGRLRTTVDRPLLASEGALDELKAARDPLYALADLRVDASRRPDEAVAAIAAGLVERAA